MKLTVSAQDLGTPEEEWLASSAITSCPTLALDKSTYRRIVVVAPHPDDEVLAVGGLLRQLCASPTTGLRVIAVSDGEASHPKSKTVSPTQLADRRAEERARALARLGVSPVETLRFGIADGHVRDARDLTDRIAESLGAADLCLAPWERDGHPDHDAAGSAAARACEARGVRMLRYPVWAWHWTNPNGDELPWKYARRVDLDAETTQAKRRAIEAYVSQIAPLSDQAGDEAILPPAVLARFLRPFEMVFV